MKASSNDHASNGDAPNGDKSNGDASTDDVLTYAMQVLRSLEGRILLVLAACVLFVAGVDPVGAQEETPPEQQTDEPGPAADEADAARVVVFTITDQTGRAIMGADVLVRPDGSDDALRQETGGTGAARFDDLPSGCATVTVLAERMRTFGDRFAISPDVDFQSILIELTPRASEEGTEITVGDSLCSAPGDDPVAVAGEAPLPPPS